MFKIKDYPFSIGEAGKVLVIAEAGINHGGSLREAKKLTLEAKKAGADVIKFQVLYTEGEVSNGISGLKGAKNIRAQWDLALKELQETALPETAYKELMDYARKTGILLTASYEKRKAADLLAGLGVSFLKLPSRELTNLPLLDYSARKNIPIILSTGMGTLEEIDQAVETIHRTGNRKLCLLHCNFLYPTPPANANLRAMKSMMAAYPMIPVGYSDHTIGVTAPIVAATLGAAVIEKHFTLDKNRKGADHSISMEPDEFARMTQAIRQVEVLLGSPLKKPASAEEKERVLGRRGLAAKEKIRQGERFTEENLDTMIPAMGLSPSFWPRVIGKRAKQDFHEGDILTLENVEW